MSSRVRASAVAVTASRGTSREDLGEAAEHAVLGAEIVSPLADAVGLVDGHQRQRQLRQPLQHRGLHQPLGRQVEQVQRARFDAAPDVTAQLGLDVGVEPLGCHARLLQGRHLVGHQRDQRRDDQAEATPQDSGDLIAEALAAAGRQDGERAASGQHLADHSRLQPAEIRVAEHAAQDIARLAQRGIVVADLGGWRIEGHGDLCNATLLLKMVQSALTTMIQRDVGELYFSVLNQTLFALSAKLS